MVSDDMLMTLSNVLGISVVVLLVAYHYVSADSKRHAD